MKKHLFAFKNLPAAWGLKGDAYDIAEANYNCEPGEELDRAIAAISLRDQPKALLRKNLDIDLKYNLITNYMHDHKVADLEIVEPNLLLLRKLEIEVANEKITPYEAARQKIGLSTKAGIERDLALLDLELRFNRLKKSEYEKQRAVLKNEPWIAIINSGFDPEQGIDGVFFEFDWNEQWIEFLKLNGYVGHNDDQIVDDWFTDVCRSHNATERMPPSHDDD